MFSVEFNFDELKGNGEICNICQLPIEGTMFVPWLQMGAPEEVTHFDPVCEKCYQQYWEC